MYVCRHLTAEIKDEWQELDDEKAGSETAVERRESLMKMINDIIPYLMRHNAEAEACDFLMEVERLDILQQYVDQAAYHRVCRYLSRYFFTTPVLHVHSLLLFRVAH